MQKVRNSVPFVFALTIILSACTHNNPQTEQDYNSSLKPRENQVLTVLTNRVDLIENGKLQRYADEFEQMHPNVAVQFQGFSNYTADIMARLATQNMGDVLLIPANMLSQDLPQYFEPLPNTLFKDIRFSDYKSYDNIRYGITTGVSTVGIIYNKKAFQKAGINEIPSTLTSFFKACEKLKQVGITPVILNYGARWPMKIWGEDLVSFMSGNANYLNEMVNEEKPLVLDNAWGKSITIVQSLISKGYVETNLMEDQWETSKQKLASGDAAMYFNGNWFIKQAIEAGANPEDLGFFPFPYNNDTIHYAPLFPDFFLGVSKFSQNKHLAQAWIEFYVKESGVVEEEGFLPVNSSISIDSSSPQIKQFISYSPMFLESVPPNDQFLRTANAANWNLWSGEYVQEWVATTDLQTVFDQFNDRWNKAKE
ncbi:sugar ABC transporter substrate-binding protein [Paenibacillus sp. CCS19]|uniref:ABC transporter substrate-binding protein n=1 Tax=Paenibacillus sp. CCS19 TaxID=3158387 RepID=UPI00255E8E3A|nr:ABC transporter substrate-binding protein [Paenibacillus cellulosilyticus]GMK37283.1 sugar ABC transporter substrate-binding protein [Paenibacillus cellulosilyticus]